MVVRRNNEANWGSDTHSTPSPESIVGRAGSTEGKFAKGLTEKIKDGITKIKAYLEEKHLIISHLSGTTETDSADGSSTTPVNLYTPYEVVLSSFLEEGERYTKDGDVLHFLGWCSNFNAGALDSIVHLLPPRRAIDSQIDRVKVEHPQTRKRRRDLAQLINNIVCRIPNQPRIVYVALGGR